MSSRPEPLFQRPFVLLLCAQTIFGLGFSTFLILPTYLATALEASAWEIGLVTSAFGLSSMIFMPLAGDWADRSTRLRWAIAGCAISGVAALGFVWVSEVGPLAFSLRLLHGIGNAFQIVAAGALVTDLVPLSRLGQGLGFFGVTMLSTNALAPALAESVAARWGWGPVFVGAGVAAFAAIGFLLAVAEPDREHERGSGASLLQVMTSRRSLWFVTVVGLMGAAFSALFTFVQPYALELGSKRISSFFVGYTVAAVAVRVVLGGLSDRAGRGRVSLAMMALYGVPMALSANLSLAMLPVIGAIFGVAHGLLYPSLNAFIVEPVPANERAKVFALFMAAFNAGWALGAIALGWVADLYGYPAVFWLATAGVAVALLVFASGDEVRREIGFS
jgi:MFS family permease